MGYKGVLPQDLWYIILDALVTTEPWSSVVGEIPQNGIHAVLTALAANNFRIYVSTKGQVIGVNISILSTEFVTEMTSTFKLDMFINAQTCC